ncbi:MAG: hypothetical protein KC620_12360, partial [Myxococcales bacterium]|nr:hypothetical protein [Myxococcales bacterium]
PDPSPSPTRDGPAPARRSGERTLVSGTGAAPAAERAAGAADPVAAPPSDEVAGDQRPVELESPLETYRRLAVFPPDSRPLTPEAVDLIDWNRRHERPSAAETDPSTTVLLSADRFRLVGDETFTAWLEVRRDDAPAPPAAVQAELLTPDGVAHPVDFSLDGERYVATFAPATLDLTAPARLLLAVRFDLGGEAPEAARLAFEYTPGAAAPARFTGRFTDAIEAGSLVIHAGLEVREQGFYLIDANLYDAAGEPVAWTRFKGALEPGETEVPLRFFGKIFTDANAEGPFALGELRGGRAAPDEAPALRAMAPFAGAHQTPPWRADDFSAAEWDAPEKRDRLRRLARLEARLGAPRIGRPRQAP